MMDLGLDQVVREFANVGLTLICFVVGIILVRWLDRNVFNKGRYNNDRRNK